MTDEDKPEILAGLPRTRPQRRSSKRAVAARPNGGSSGAPKPSTPRRPPPRPARRSEPLRQPKQPAGTPPAPPIRRPAPPSGPEIIGTLVQAAVELAEIGVSAATRALRNTLGRIPRP
jgi:hypothetical protein